MGVFDFFDIDLQNCIPKLFFVNNGIKSNSPTFSSKSKHTRIEICLPRNLGTCSLYLHIYDEYISSCVATLDAKWSSSEREYDVYSLELDTAALGRGIFFYKMEILSAFGKVYCGKSSNKFILGGSIYDVDFCQFTIYTYKYKYPKKYCGGTIYHIFVDRFNRGTSPVPLADGVIIDEFKNGITEYPEYPGAPLKNNHFYGGNLRGIINKLDYIKSLGTSIIYLSPIFEAESNHKYDTADYMAIDRMFGNEADFCELVQKASEKGIGIILDGVFNHTGSNSRYFNKNSKYDTLGAYQSKNSPFYNWYEFQSYPDKYTCWWGIDILPRINTSLPECCNYFVGKGGVVEKYSRMGIAGFRLDVADELSDSFISDIKRVLNKNSSDSILYGEVWEDASNKVAYDVRKHYYLGEELDAVMNYPLRTGIIEYLRDKRCDAINYALTDIINNAPERIRNLQMNLLGTHDTERILTVLGGESAQGYTNSELVKKRMSPEQRKAAVAKLKCAYTILATVPGLPTIFYADEAGLEGYSDPFNRMPYPWGREDKSLVAFYRTIARIRNAFSYAYSNGDFKLIELNPKCLIFARYARNYAYLTVVNNSNKKIKFRFDRMASGQIYGTHSEEIVLPANSAEILKIHSKSNIMSIEF